MADQFKTHPQPRTFAPSKEDVLQVRSAARPTRAYAPRLPAAHAYRLPSPLACAQNLQYFFGAPVSPEKLKDVSSVPSNLDALIPCQQTHPSP